MAGLGLIATGAALLNYRKAKSEYDSLVEQRDGLMAAYESINSAVDQYNEHKYDSQEQPETAQEDNSYLDRIDTKPNDMPKGLKVTTMLRVANLVGQLFYGRTSVFLENTGDEPIFVRRVEAECSVLDLALIAFKPGLSNLKRQIKVAQVAGVGKAIQPGEMLEVQLDKFVSGLGEKQGELRDLICEANGKKLITSCGKTNIDGGEKADILIQWIEGDSWSYPEDRNIWSDMGKDIPAAELGLKQAYWINKPGVLRYCGEAGLN